MSKLDEVNAEKSNKVNAIIQARCGSTRFPNKVFSLVNGEYLLWHVVNRLRYVASVDDIVVATTTNRIDDAIENWCIGNKVDCFRGSEDDVLNRFYSAYQQYPSDVVIRITADDPFKEPTVIEKVLNTYLENDYDYVTNNFPPTFPEGLDCEVFSGRLLCEMEKKSHDAYEREHVTQYVFRHLDEYKIANITNDGDDLSYLRWTIDTQDDLDMVNRIYALRKCDNGILLMDEILDILEKNPEVKLINSKVARSAMYGGERYGKNK